MSLPALALGACLSGSLFAGCLFDLPQDRPGNTKVGQVRMTLSLEATPSLRAKAAAGGDTIFHMDSLIVVLTAPGQAPLTFSHPISGRADQGTIGVVLPVYTLAALRQWTARFYSIDTTLNPSRRDTVHIDSVTFAVRSAEVTHVSASVSPAYSILRVRILSNRADSLGSGLKFMRLRVDGVTRDSVSLRGIPFNAVHFVNATTGWAVADSGRIYRSLDSGVTWFPQPSGTARNLRSVWFVNATTGWAAGDGGTIHRSTNGGAAWTQQSTYLGARNFTRVQFSDANNGYLVGENGAMLRTRNGGSDWESMAGDWYATNSTVGGIVHAMRFLGGAAGWFVGEGGIVRKTTNAGLTWGGGNSGSPQTLRGFFPYDANELYAAGDAGRVVRSTNGGTSWSPYTAGSAQLNGIALAKSQVGLICPIILCTQYTTGLAVGAGGAIQRSSDGTTWSAATSGTTQDLTAAQVFDVSGLSRNFRAYAVGGNAGGNTGVILTSTGDGGSWSTQTTIAQPLHALDCITAATCWAAGGNGTILRTTNSGTNWVGQASGTTQTLRAIDFVDANVGHATGDGGVILKTTNGGGAWVAQASNTDQPLYAVATINTDSAYAAGAAGTALKTRGGGVGATTLSLYGTYFRGDTGYVVGVNGLTFRSHNAGVRWTTITNGTAQTLRSVFISPSGNNVYAVGDAGTYRYMTNPGAHTVWAGGASGTTRNLRHVSVSSNFVYAAGDSGTVRTSPSYGDLTGSLPSGMTGDILGMSCAPSQNLCWAVGENETVVRGDSLGWAERHSGAKLFDRLMTFKYLRPNTPTTVTLQVIDRLSPLRGYQASTLLTVGAGVDSTLALGLTRCGYGGATPSCSP